MYSRLIQQSGEKEKDVSEWARNGKVTKQYLRMRTWKQRKMEGKGGELDVESISRGGRNRTGRQTDTDHRVGLASGQ
jgi:hypothetical protein